MGKTLLSGAWPRGLQCWDSDVSQKVSPSAGVALAFPSLNLEFFRSILSHLFSLSAELL